MPDDAPLMLSVSGVRGIVGQSMTPAVAAQFAAAFGSHLRESTGSAHPVICIGRDSRPSGDMLLRAAVSGLASVGCKVIELGIVATPSVAVMIGEHSADGGMEITASHNPKMWNGLKCLNADGVAPPKTEAEQIIRRFRESQIEYVAVDQLQPVAADQGANETHVRRVLSNVDVEQIRRATLKVVLDSINGAGCESGRMLLEQLGCDIVHLNGEPTGHFAHAPEPTEENLTDLAQQTKQHGAAVGFAQDPDADRLAIVDERGRYIGEEYTLVLAAKRIFDTRGAGTAAANLSTSRMIDDLAARYTGSQVLRTAVGEANVVEAMKPSGAIIGGEGNGGVIFPPVCWVRDSLSAMALVLDLMAAERRPLSAIVDSLPRYAMMKHKFDLSAVDRPVDVMLAHVIERFTGAAINATDGVRVDLEDGWVHLRASNTEPILRLIVEARTREQAQAIIEEVAQATGLQAARV